MLYEFRPLKWLQTSRGACKGRRAPLLRLRSLVFRAPDGVWDARARGTLLLLREAQPSTVTN